MNEFFADSAYFSRRCVNSLDSNMGIDAIYDAILHMAFCIERLFKGVLWDVDPRLVLEDSKDENVFAVLHRDKLIPRIKATIEKNCKNERANHNTITFKEAMLKAKNFSQVTHDHIGILTQLSDYRGTVVHRFLSDLDLSIARRFVLRYFYPIISGLVKEHKLDALNFFSEHETELANYAKTIEKEENQAEKMEDLLEIHRKSWEEQKNNKDFIENAKRLTDLRLKDRRRSDYWHLLTTCPACDNNATIRAEADWEVDISSGIGRVTGKYVAGLSCEYCGLELGDYEQIDFFKLNEILRDD